MQAFYKKYANEIIGAIGCLSLGLISGYAVSAGDSAWYMQLHKPFFNPPGWLFAPVWTLLYLMLGIALGKLWQHTARNRLPLILFILQLGCNFAWSPLFFYRQRIDLALFDITVLWLLLCLFMWSVWNNRTVFLLCLPYMLWVSFAAVLNGALYWLN